MMWQIFVYAAAVAAALSLVGVGLERVAARRGQSQRMVWAAVMAVSLLFPVLAMWQAEPVAVTEASPASFLRDQTGHALAAPAATISADMAEPGDSEPGAAARSHVSWQSFVPANRTLMLLWVLVSLACLLYQAGASWLLHRRALAWRRAVVLQESVLVSESLGPALLGVLRPRIVVPQWFLDETVETQSLILAHERQHLLARDPLLLWCCVLAAALIPWNLPLWWHLRRLRFAIELDCDARVLRAGAEPDVYGEVLLTVTRRALSVPVGAIAMSEPASALERRIRSLVSLPGRFVMLRIAGAIVLAVLGVGIALMLRAPAMRTATLRAGENQSSVLVSASSEPSRTQSESAQRKTEEITPEIIPGAADEKAAAASLPTQRQSAPDERVSQRSADPALKSPLLPVNYDPWRARLHAQNLALRNHADLLLPYGGDEVNRLTILLTEDGRVAREVVEHIHKADLTPLGSDPGPAQRLAETIARRFQVDVKQLGAVGITDAIRQVGRPESDQPDRVVVVFAWPRRAGESGPIMLLDDRMRRADEDALTLAMARQDSLDDGAALAMVERHIPAAFTDSEEAAGNPVIVLSSRGEFIRAGRVRIPGGGPGPKLVQDSRLLGVTTSQVSWKTLRNAAGGRTDVLFAWQAP